jgi:hypothetical protein
MYQQKCPIYQNSKAVRDMVLLLMHVRKGLITIFPIDTKDQIADASTAKALAQNDFQHYCRYVWQVTSPSNQSEEVLHIRVLWCLFRVLTNVTHFQLIPVDPSWIPDIPRHHLLRN